MGSFKTALQRALSSVPFPILRGRLKGSLWLIGSGGKLARVILSTYEPDEIARFCDLIKPHDTVFDIGAHMGYYTLFAASVTGPDGTIVAFEPEPRNAHFLRRHMEINRHSGVIVEELALGDRSGTVSFQPEGSGTGHLADEGEITVRMQSLDEYVEQTGREPNVMKIDVEGAEALVLQGGDRTLRSLRPKILLSTHGPEVERECRELLDGAGYEVETLTRQKEGDGAQLLCTPGPAAG